MILMDVEFEQVDEILRNIEVDIVAAREHTGEAERTTRNVK